jgi:hypothetical protein
MYLKGNKRQAEMTADPKKYPQGFFKEKPCRLCSTVFKPMAPSHMYCSQGCADIALIEKYLQREYKINYSQYMEMLKSQDDKCAICGSEGFKMQAHHKIKLVVDHCHSTGRVRGMLCHNCNRGLGLFQDSVQFLQSASSYLQKTSL